MATPHHSSNLPLMPCQLLSTCTPSSSFEAVRRPSSPLPRFAPAASRSIRYSAPPSSIARFWLHLFTPDALHSAASGSPREDPLHSHLQAVCPCCLQSCRVCLPALNSLQLGSKTSSPELFRLHAQTNQLPRHLIMEA